MSHDPFGAPSWAFEKISEKEVVAGTGRNDLRKMVVTQIAAVELQTIQCISLSTL
tara:strand:+ start:222 stop:386 length:165 start_codon:yes stop_codon:yes gene_type:complete